MCSLCRDRNSCEDETCNSHSVLVNIRFFKYHIWKPSLQLQKSNRFYNNFARASCFLYISLPSLHDYDMKVPFCGGRKHNTATFFFFSWTSIQSLSPSLLLELPQVPFRERGVKFRHLVYEIWSVSYLFFSFQIWYLRKWKFTSIGQSKHTRVTRFNPSGVSGQKHCGFWRNFQAAVLFVLIHSTTYFIVFPVLVILHFVFSSSEESAARLCSALCFNIYLDC